MSECKTLETWQAGGNTLRLDLEDNGAYVLRLFNLELDTPSQIADEIPMSPAVALVVARALIRHLRSNK